MSLPCEDFFDSREDFVVLIVVVVVPIVTIVVVVFVLIVVVDLIVLVVLVVEVNFAVVDFVFSPKERNEITK